MSQKVVRDLRAWDLAEKADPFTKRRLLDLAKHYDAAKLPAPLRVGEQSGIPVYG